MASTNDFPLTPRWLRQWRPWNKPEVRFVRHFLFLAVLASLAWTMLGSAQRVVVDAVQWMVALGSRGTGLEVQAGAEGLLRFDGVFEYVITLGCTGMTPVLMYGAAVLAYPTPMRARWLGVLVGVPLLLIGNLLRLIGMAWIGVRRPSFFEDFHVIWAQAIFILAVALTWIAWSTWATRREQPSARLGSGTLLVAAGICLGSFVTLAFLGSMTGLATAYGRLILGTAEAAIAWIWNTPVTPAPPQVVAFFSLLWYAAAAAVLSLYLCTPRAPFPKRALHGLLVGVPLIALLQVIWILGRSHPIGGDLTFNSFLLTTLQTMLPLITWFLWARKWRAPSDPKTCPACGTEHEDVRNHIQERHAHNANRLMNRLSQNR